MSEGLRLFFNLKKSTFETRKNKLFAFELLCPSNKKYVSLNKLESKYNLFDEIWPVYVILENKTFLKRFYPKCGQETSSKPFCVLKEPSTTPV